MEGGTPVDVSEVVVASPACLYQGLYSCIRVILGNV